MAHRDTNAQAYAPRNRKHNLILGALRVLQFLSASISLIFFSLRLAKIIRLANKASKSNGAVEGILVAAVLYTLCATIFQFVIRSGGSQKARILLIILDILFVGAFIAVAILTSPKRHGSSGPCNTKSAQLIGKYSHGSTNCNLPWGTFILAIISTLLHAVTTAYHAARHNRNHENYNHGANKETHHSDGTRDGYQNNGL